MNAARDEPRNTFMHIPKSGRQNQVCCAFIFQRGLEKAL